MEILLISSMEVAQLFSMKDSIDVMEKTLTDQTLGHCTAPQRQALWLPDKSGLIGTMPAFDTSLEKLAVKVLSVFPFNRKYGYDSHQGVVVLFDGKHGKPLAIVNAGEITGIRTAAVSAVATRLLSREAAGDLVIIGCGFQAIKHVEAMILVRPIHRIRAWDLYPDSSRAFAEKILSLYGMTVEIIEGQKAEVEGADIICTLTPSADPILFGRDVAPGVHINAVGSCTPNTREVDTELIIKSRIFVDKKDAALHEAGDILIPISKGEITENHIIGEIGQICTQEIEGRQSEEDITFFEALGLALEDLAAANFIYNKAIQMNYGTMIDL